MTSSWMNSRSFLTPFGVTCPHVSQTQILSAPNSMALAYTCLISSGLLLVVSSVTNITGISFSTAKVTAFSAVSIILPIVHPSANCLIGLVPRNALAWICLSCFACSSTSGSISETTVLTAHPGLRLYPFSPI